MKLKLYKLVFASIFTFVSGIASAGLITSTGTGGAIPDNNASGLNSVIAIGQNQTIDNVSLTIFGLSTTWVGDLIIKLTSPDTSAYVLYRAGSTTGSTVGDSSNLSGDYTFEDGGVDFWTAILGGGTDFVVPTGVYAPSGQGNATVNFASIFGGTSTLGNWTLNISDNATADAASFRSWELNITYSDSNNREVPAPSSLALLGLSLLAFSRLRRKS